MTVVQIDPAREIHLNVQRLRELIRESRGKFAPDHVGASLRHHVPAPSEEDTREISDLLRELIDNARDRLHDAGIEAENRKIPTLQKLSKRERDYVANLAALLTFRCAALSFVEPLDEALLTGEEGLAWCRVCNDGRQESILWRVVAIVRQTRGEQPEEERAYRSSLEAARRSESAEEIVRALHELGTHLIMRWRLDEAETVSEEALAIARTELTEEERRRQYPYLLVNSGLVPMYRTHYAEGIRILREALRWADADVDPMGRAVIMAHLGSVYLRLQQYQQSIECQHEVIRLSEIADSNRGRAWGYYRLAEAHWSLDELQQAEETLDKAEEFAPVSDRPLRLMIRTKRGQVYGSTDRIDEAAEICRRIIAEIEGGALDDLEVFTHKTLAEIEERRERWEEAEYHFRCAVETAKRAFPPRAPAIEIGLAELLHRLERDEEVLALLDGISRTASLNPSEEMRIARLRAKIAENVGDLATALEHERQAFAHERLLLERRAEESLRNARIVAETDLLEREADLERERRRRVERELAEAIIALGDRKRLVETVEERLRRALERAGGEQERSVFRALRETLSELRSQSSPTESPLRYLNGVDDEFYHRLRERWPDLTPKQERLCGLLRAGLASKEIATVLGLGTEGLKAQRKRLRKKLGLAADDGLEAVLTRL